MRHGMGELPQELHAEALPTRVTSPGVRWRAWQETARTACTASIVHAMVLENGLI